MTLLDRLRELERELLDARRMPLADDFLGALPAVLALIEAAQGYLRVANTFDEKVVTYSARHDLHAALEPFTKDAE